MSLLSQRLDPLVDAVWRLRALLRALYHGESRAAVRFRYGVIVLDLMIIALFIAAPLWKSRTVFLPLDYAIAAFLGVDIAARFLASSTFWAWARRPQGWLDLFVLATLLFPQWLFNLGFLRVIRLWTLFHSEFFWRTVGRRYDDTRVEQVVKTLATLATFVFVMTGFVYTSFALRHDGIRGYVDALYFTVASLTTTGYGDIVLPGTWGRVLSIVTMLTGISLFLRLVQTLFRASTVRRPHPGCPIECHDPDARHCKGCGAVLRVPEEGA